MSELHNIVRAMILGAGEKMISAAEIKQALPDIVPTNINMVLDDLELMGGDVYDIKRAGNHYHAVTKQEYAKYVAHVAEEKPRNFERKALLEVLAIIVLKQPVSRTEIEEMRGVKLNFSIIHDLQNYGWVKVMSTGKDNSHLYGTTLEFLRYFGLSSITEFEDKFYKSWMDSNSSDILQNKLKFGDMCKMITRE